MMRRVGVIAVVLAACSHASVEPTEAAEEVAPVEVETVQAEAAQLAPVTPFHGSFVADRSSHLAADASGKVLRILVDRGDAVQAGQVLLEVDARTAQLTADAGEAQVALANAQKAAVEVDCGRFGKLFEEGAISAAQLERSQAQCVAQARSVDAASAQLRIAETNAARTRVKAPFAGIVEDRLVQVGEFVGTATPVIALVATDPVRVRFPVPERDLATVLAAGELTVRATAIPDRTFTATLMPLPPTAREESRDLMIEARIANPDGVLRPGLSATVEIHGAAQSAVAVPADAVIGDDTVHRLFVVRDHLAHETIVHVERLADGRLAVSPDIAVGDEIVLRPPPSLRDGAQVR